MGTNSIAVLAQTATGEYSATEFNVTFDDTADHLLVANGTLVSGSLSFEVPLPALAQVVSYSRSYSGHPSGFSYGETSVGGTGTGLLINYTMSATSETTPGRYTISVQYDLLNSSSAIVHTEIIDFIIDIVAP